MSQQNPNQQQSRDASALHHAQADGMRRAQQQEKIEIQRAAQGLAHVSMTPQQGYYASMTPQQFGRMNPVAMYSDIPVVDDYDFDFLGHANKQTQPSFSSTPKPAFLDEFEAACRQDQVATLQQIITQHPYTPATLHHGLTLALAAGSVHAAHELLIRGAPLAQRAPEEFLRSAPQAKQILLLDILVTHGWKPSHDLFLWSVCDTKLLQWFLSHGANPNYGNKPDTPYKAGGPSYECADALEIAAKMGSPEAIEVLIEAGAKVAYGVPLHRAAGASADVTVPYARHASLPFDVDGSCIRAMAALLKHGANVDQKEETHHITPQYAIVYAVIGGSIRRVQWLLDHGADPRLEGPYGSAMDHAEKMGTDVMKALLQSWACSH